MTVLHIFWARGAIGSAAALQAEGYGFESRPVHYSYWVVVLMAERVAVNHHVGGSSPSFPAKFIARTWAHSSSSKDATPNRVETVVRVHHEQILVRAMIGISELQTTRVILLTLVPPVLICWSSSAGRAADL